MASCFACFYYKTRGLIKALSSYLKETQTHQPAPVKDTPEVILSYHINKGTRKKS